MHEDECWAGVNQVSAESWEDCIEGGSLLSHIDPPLVTHLWH